MGAHVIFDLLNEVRRRDQTQGLQNIYHFCNANSIIQAHEMLDVLIIPNRTQSSSFLLIWMRRCYGRHYIMLLFFKICDPLVAFRF